jgi:glycine cleavage system H protein
MAIDRIGISMKKYSKEHLWAKFHKDGLVTMGLSFNLVNSFDEIVHIEFPSFHQKIKKGEILCIIETNKAAIEIESPLTGKIHSINHDLEKKISLLKTDPENLGYLCKMENIFQEEFENLLSEKEYKKQFEN